MCDMLAPEPSQVHRDTQGRRHGMFSGGTDPGLKIAGGRQISSTLAVSANATDDAFYHEIDVGLRKKFEENAENP